MVLVEEPARGGSLLLGARRPGWMTVSGNSTHVTRYRLLSAKPRRVRRMLLATAVMYALSIAHCALAAPEHRATSDRQCGTCCNTPLSTEALQASPADDCCEAACACCHVCVTDDRDADFLPRDTDCSADTDAPAVEATSGSQEVASATFRDLRLPAVPKRALGHSSPIGSRAPPSLLS